MNRNILDFKRWFDDQMLHEIGEGEIQTARGADLFKNPAMEVAMYICYRQAYDPINKRDREEEVKHLSTTHSISPEEAEQRATTSATAWTHGEWTYPSSGGTRAPEWLFTGIFPTEADLAQIQKYMGGGGEQMESWGKRSDSGMIQQVADKIMQDNAVPMAQAGGLAWRDDDAKAIKITGMWGSNRFGKIRGAGIVTAEANKQGKEIFTGADAELKDTIEKAEKLMPGFHKKGLVPEPSFGIQQPPKEVIPLLYDILTKHPGARGSGQWTGYNPETGGMKFQLSGSGEREKFVFGNKPMWKTNIGKALQQVGVDAGKAAQARQALQQGGMMGNMAAMMINQQLKKYFKGIGDIPASGLLWLLQQAE